MAGALSPPAAPGAVGSSQQTLSEYAGPYVTSMLGKAEALSEQPYQVYGGPQTAAESGLQSKVFQGLGSLNFPGQLGQTFSSTGAYQPPSMMTQPMNVPSQGQPTGIASQYMNPYLQSVLQPQMEELRRQSQINLQPSMAQLTRAGGYGGGRQAIMQSEADRNLLAEQNKTIGLGYSSAYDKGLQQFNTEQAQARGLADFMADQGGQQRGIEQQGISADYNEFLAQRDYPQKMLQFQQSMLQGLPISTVSNQPAQMSGIGNLAATVGGAGDLITKLKNLGVQTSSLFG